MITEKLCLLLEAIFSARPGTDLTNDEPALVTERQVVGNKNLAVGN